MTSLQAAWDRALARERASEIAVEGFGGGGGGGGGGAVVVLAAHDRWAAAGSAYALRRPARPSAWPRAGAGTRAGGRRPAPAGLARRPSGGRCPAGPGPPRRLYAPVRRPLSAPAGRFRLRGRHSRPGIRLSSRPWPKAPPTWMPPPARYTRPRARPCGRLLACTPACDRRPARPRLRRARPRNHGSDARTRRTARLRRCPRPPSAFSRRICRSAWPATSGPPRRCGLGCRRP